MTPVRSKTVVITAVLLVCALAVAAFTHHRRSRYEEARRLAEAGDTQGAYEVFTALGGYSDAAERARGLVEEDPALPYRSVAPGDTVTFGSYEQDNNTANGPEAIRWIVLDRIDDQVLLLSADCLEGRQYHHVPFEEVTWENSDLREWMNGFFYAQAFTPAQQTIVRTVHNENSDQSVTGAPGGADTDDRVFALSETEALIYLAAGASRSDVSAAAATEYAASGALSVTEDGTVDWWLRSPGTYGFAAQFVDASGKPMISGANVDAQYGARPALWISIAKADGSLR